ncbi:MAG: cobalt-precorrin 5A hydrolase [Lachnospiraceae bacterium]|nr:cobalt-precorrin 5A hydrolase [Lachnospiraceae bacterium]
MQNNSRHGIVIISYTGAGAQLQQKLGRILVGMVPEEDVYQFGYRKPETDFSDANSIAVFSKTEEILDQHFDTAELIVFISATGIAVRKIAPYLKSKTTDPAVLCMDETGKFVIPLVSGHLGGANEWAQKIEERTGATAVITTATDIEKVFAVDLFAKKNGLRIADSSKIKEVSSRLLAGEKVGICSAYEIGGKVPEGLVYCDRKDVATERPECGIMITEHVRLPQQFAIECRLIPKDLILGIGCRKGTPAENMERFVRETLEQNGWDLRDVCAVASIDIKKEEAGIVALTEKLGVPFLVFDAEQLKNCKGEYTASSFVAAQVGVDNVCERSAMCVAGDGGRLLLKKTASEGMTLAVAAGGRVTIQYSL